LKINEDIVTLREQHLLAALGQLHDTLRNILATSPAELDEILSAVNLTWEQADMMILSARVKHQQIVQEITALMAAVWLAACDRRVIGTTADGKFVVFVREGVGLLFGPASGDECRLFIHRMAALDVLRALGTERVADANLRVADSAKAPMLNG
jgi:hypothetical protein